MTRLSYSVYTRETERSILKLLRMLRPTLQRIIRGHANIDSIIHIDGWRRYDGLVDLGYERHFRVNHGNNEFSDTKGNHINGIEGFGGYAKHRLMKFKGIPKEHFQIHLL